LSHLKPSCRSRTKSSLSSWKNTFREPWIILYLLYYSQNFILGISCRKVLYRNKQKKRSVSHPRAKNFECSLCFAISHYILHNQAEGGKLNTLIVLVPSSIKLKFSMWSYRVLSHPPVPVCPSNGGVFRLYFVWEFQRWNQAVNSG
jgi:hypothetical protein